MLSFRNALAEETPSDAAAMLLAAVTDAEPTEAAQAKLAAGRLRYDGGYILSMPDSDGVVAAPDRDNVPAAVAKMIAAGFDGASLQTQALFDGITLSAYGDYAAHAERFQTLSERIAIACRQSLADVMPTVSGWFRQMELPMLPPNWVETAPHWKYVAAFCHAFGLEEGAMRMVRSMQVELTRQVGGGTALTIRYPSIETACATAEREQLMQARFAYAYLNTVYDDAGSLLEPTRDALPESDFSTLIHPTPGDTIKDGWYLPRSNGTRVHMGTDIRSVPRKRIHSVTDGTVLYIGYMDIPGYYVVVRDPYGYEYHYYHLNENTRFVQEGDTVRQGDVIGRVGNTGNSAAYHLHLAIISPDGRYLNPYNLFRDAGIGPILS